jgi:hypothetical protein
MSVQNDIFISYAHLDNEPALKGQEGWISSFHHALEVRVGQLLGRPPRIWRDPKLDGNDVFSDAIVEQLPSVAVLVTVLSPRYLKSEWCRREVATFWQACGASGGAVIGTKCRVLKVIKTPVPDTEAPSELKPILQPLLGYPFYKLERDTGRPREFDPSLGPDILAEYWKRLDDLAQDIAALLAKMHLEDVPSKGKVYVAPATRDVDDEHDALRRDLLRKGYAVAPDRPLPLAESDLIEFLRKEFQSCEMSMHLIGRNYGVVPEESSKSLTEIQHDVAAEHASATAAFTVMTWMERGIQGADPRQAAFIERLRGGAALSAGTDLLETPFEEFKTVMYDRLERKRTPEPTARFGIPQNGAVKSVYLICDQRDCTSVMPLRDFLFSKGYEVFLPAFDGDEAEIREDHEQNLRVCDGVIIYYGAGSDLFLRRKLREIQKGAGQGRSTPVRAAAVYVAPPLTHEKSLFRTLQAQVILQSGDFRPESLQSFLEQLE